MSKHRSSGVSRRGFLAWLGIAPAAAAMLPVEDLLPKPDPVRDTVAAMRADPGGQMFCIGTPVAGDLMVSEGRVWRTHSGCDLLAVDGIYDGQRVIIAGTLVLDPTANGEG